MTEPATTEVLGKPGEPCRECGAPLATDQRYCLNCGRRRGELRIDFRGHLSDAAGASANGSAPVQAQPDLVEPPPSAPAPTQRDYTPLAAVGGIAVLGIMLLIGVLIGKGDNGGSVAAPAPVVVQGGEAGGEKTAAEEGGEAGAKAKPAKAKGGKGAAAKGGKVDTGNAPVADDQALQALQEGTPEEKSERSAELPDEIATPGEAPPEDNKAPGGGSKGTAIE
jgi:hypothetical protein